MNTNYYKVNRMKNNKKIIFWDYQLRVRFLDIF